MTASVLHLEGDLDMSRTESVRQRMEASLARADRVELDLGGVSSLSSAIVAVFADMQRRALDMGKAFDLGNASDVAARVLTLFRFDNVLNKPNPNPLHDEAYSPIDQPIDQETGRSPKPAGICQDPDTPSAPAASSCNRLYWTS